ncbi:MAG: VWA domain-containing protein [Candidatus Heimdallarchaeota archaeon]|nr:MAG: VWA domain-containing protein [Candidatus Heimdallarchaeota archaeon]
MTHTVENEDLMIEVTPSSPYALRNGETHLYIQLKLTGVEIPVSETRPNLNLGVVLDRSGSMHGSKLQKAKEAVQFVVANLSKEDIFALTVYDHEVNTIVPSAKITNRNSILAKLRSVKSRGRTNLHGGIVEGTRQVESAKPLEYRNVALLLSDGLANEGIIDRNRIRDFVSNIYEGGIGISTFGVGEDFDEDLMVNIADAAGGSFYFIETADDIPRFIEQEFKGLLQTTAYNIEVEWTSREGVRLRRALGVPYEDRKSNHTKLGDLRTGNELLVILDVTVPPSETEDSEMEIMTFSIRWIPRSGPTEPVQFKVPCTITYTMNESLLATEDDHVLENVSILEAASVQYEAMEMADQGDFLGAQHTMQTFQEKLGQRVAQTGSPALMKLKEQSAQMLSDVLSEDKYTKSSRKKLRSAMYDLRKRR